MKQHQTPQTDKIMPAEVPSPLTMAAMEDARQMQNQAFKGMTQFFTPQEQLRYTRSLLQRAESTITGQRQTDYGDKLQNFTQIAMLFQGLLAPKLLPTSRITPEDVALLMIMVKAARLAKSPDHNDSWLDIAGYAGCADILQSERSDGKPLLGSTVDPRAV